MMLILHSYLTYETSIDWRGEEGGEGVQDGEGREDVE